jgi:hypothetical protein
MKNTLTRSSLVLVLIAIGATASAGETTPLPDEAAAKFNKAADVALREMKLQAESRKMSGVAVVAFIPGEKTATWTSRMQVVGSIVVNKSNVLGVAYTKAAEMADTLQNSGGGSRPPWKGEFGYKGGVIEKHAAGYLLAVFSGGKSEDDVAVAKIGLAELGKTMEAGATDK